MARRRKKVSFWATKIVKKPVKVAFRTYDGERVAFWATKAVVKDVKVTFYKKGKKRR